MSSNTRTDIGGFNVDTTHRTKFECPSCDDVQVLYYLGTSTQTDKAAEVVGWVCSECETEIQELIDSRGAAYDMVEVEE